MQATFEITLCIDYAASFIFLNVKRIEEVMAIQSLGLVKEELFGPPDTFD